MKEAARDKRPGVSEDGKRRNLGRGLSALFRETAEAPSEANQRMARLVPTEQLRPGRFQPRRQFDAESLASLAQSVSDKGILQPLVVRRRPEGHEGYEIIAGERRWRAAQMAKLHEIPVLVRDLTDREALEIALVENIQRRDLTPLEEAEGFRRLMEEFGHTQEALAQSVGKSRSHIANTLRLLSLPEPVRRMLEDGRLTAGHARALLNATAPEVLAEEVVRRGLNVRQTERLAQTRKTAAPAAAPGAAAGAGPGAAKDADTRALERQLALSLGLKVSVDWRGEQGTLTVHYRTLEQLDEVIRRLGQVPVTA